MATWAPARSARTTRTAHPGRHAHAVVRAVSGHRRRAALVLACSSVLVGGVAVATDALAPHPAAVAVAAAPRHSAAATASRRATAAAVAAAQSAVPVPAPSVAASAPAPTALDVPALGLSTTLVRLGTNPDGTLQVPTTYSRAGWFDQGPAPGQVGPAVIAGHLDSKAGPGVFARLAQLRPGDGLTVHRADGSSVAFVVTRSVEVAKTAFPTAEVYGPTAGPELRLITCGGAFDRATGHYVDNIVVFAREV